jgi:adenylate cyclase
MLERDWDAGSQTIERALLLNPSSPTAGFLASLKYAFVGRTSVAERHAKRALRLNSQHLLSYQADLALGIAAVQKRNYGAAAAHFVQSVEKAPDLSCLYFHGGVAFALSGLAKPADQLIRRGLEVQPDFRLRMFSELMVPAVADQFVEAGRTLGVAE